MLRRVDNSKTKGKLVAPCDATKFGPPTYAASRALARAYVKAAPGRLIGGTNGPHPGEDPKPDDALLFDPLLDWAPDVVVRHRILVENPGDVVRFPADRLSTSGQTMAGASFSTPRAK